MGKFRAWWRTHRPTTRRLAQIYCALLYNANIRGFVEGSIYTGKTKAACVPGLNCYSCPGAVGACPLGALQNAVASSGARAGTYVIGILMLFGVMLGRTVCGWLCPAGLVQELLFKIPTPKIRKSRFTRLLSLLKYGILAVFVLALPLWYAVKHQLPVPAFCKYICPAGTLEGAGGLLIHEQNSGMFAMLGALFTQKALILLAVGLACIFCYRTFCRFLCPLGAIYSFFCRAAIIGVKVDQAACIHCDRCVRACRMDVDHVGDRECIHCGECMDSCPTGAISIRAGESVTLKVPRTLGGLKAETVFENEHRKTKSRGRAVWAMLLVILAAALVYFDFAPGEQATGASGVSPLGVQETLEEPSTAPIGYAPGERLEDFTVDTLDGGTFHLADHAGHATIINLWATYCAPCIQELSYFSRIALEHPEVRVLAVHASLLTEENLPGYLAGKEWDGVQFALDLPDDRIYGIVGADALLPRTIVLNRRGEVTYNQAGSMDYETLRTLLEQAEAP